MQIFYPPSTTFPIRAPVTPATTLGNCLSSLLYRSSAGQSRAPKWPPLVAQKSAFSKTS
jgi:hypothetical protein